VVTGAILRGQEVPVNVVDTTGAPVTTTTVTME
jgi:hypothetical protein